MVRFQTPAFLLRNSTVLSLRRPAHTSHIHVCMDSPRPNRLKPLQSTRRAHPYVRLDNEISSCNEEPRASLEDYSFGSVSCLLLLRPGPSHLVIIIPSSCVGEALFDVVCPVRRQLFDVLLPLGLTLDTPLSAVVRSRGHCCAGFWGSANCWISSSYIAAHMATMPTSPASSLIVPFVAPTVSSVGTSPDQTYDDVPAPCVLKPQQTHCHVGGVPIL